MVNVEGLGRAQIANRAFVQLAVEAGIIPVMRSIVGLAMTKNRVVIELAAALETDNPELAMAINTQTLDALLEYMSAMDTPAVVDALNLPTALDEDGPAVVTAGRDSGDATQLNIGFSEPLQDYMPEIYLDGVYIKDSVQASTDGTVFDIISGVEAGAHTVRVLFRDPDGGLTRFGPVASIEE